MGLNSTEEELDTAEEVDETIEELADLLRHERGDLAVAIDVLMDAIHEADGDPDADELAENVTLPFRDEDEELSFTIGLTLGALLELREWVEDEEEKMPENPGEVMP